MKSAPNRGRYSLGFLMENHPGLKDEVARLIAQAASTGQRKANRAATFGDMRQLGSSVIRTLNALAAEQAEMAETHGLTLDNSWRFTAFAALAKELYPVGRDALGIPPLAPVKEGPKQIRPHDWRQALLEVEAQKPEPVPEVEPETPPETAG